MNAFAECRNKTRKLKTIVFFMRMDFSGFYRLLKNFNHKKIKIKIS